MKDTSLCFVITLAMSEKKFALMCSGREKKGKNRHDLREGSLPQSGPVGGGGTPYLLRYMGRG
jgi:hypothetical protein